MIRCGVVGVGWAGQQHLAAIDELAGAELTRVIDACYESATDEREIRL